MGMDPSRRAWSQAEALLAKTLALDDRSSEAHALLGIIKLQFRCDRSAAEKELNLALDLNPRDIYALDFHSYYLLEIGRNDEAIAEKKIVLEHDPLSVRTNAELGLYYLHTGRTDEAIAQLQKTLELDPNYAAAHVRLGRAYDKKQQYALAIMEIQKAISLDKKPARLAQLGELYARLHKTQEALQEISELQEMSKQQYVAPSAIALIYSTLGRSEAAIAWLQRARIDDDPKLSERGFDNLRSDARFKILEARLRRNESCPDF